MPWADKLQEAAAKYIAEMLLTLALLAVGAVAILADRILPPEVFDRLGSYATGRIVLGLCLALLVLIAWIVYLHPRLKFDARLGVFHDSKSGFFYCTKCRAEKRIRVPMKLAESGIGWRCSVCKTLYDNPDYKEPPPRPRIRSNMF